MTLHVQPKALADALSRAMGAVDHNKNYPILSTILMVASGGQLTRPIACSPPLPAWWIAAHQGPWFGAPLEARA